MPRPLLTLSPLLFPGHHASSYEDRVWGHRPPLLPVLSHVSFDSPDPALMRQLSELTAYPKVQERGSAIPQEEASTSSHH